MVPYNRLAKLGANRELDKTSKTMMNSYSKSEIFYPAKLSKKHIEKMKTFLPSKSSLPWTNVSVINKTKKP